MTNWQKAPRGCGGNLNAGFGKVMIYAKICYLCTRMTLEEKTKTEEEIVNMLKTVFDPEIPIDIYSLGLIYKIDLDDEGKLDIDMTLTAPTCPAGDFIVEDARIKLESVPGVKNVVINIVFEPEWNKDMMSDEAKLELGFL